jgi:hypothetical protein
MKLKIEMMSKTVDSWKSTGMQRKANEAPVLTPEQVKAVQQRIANWNRKNF